MNFDVLPAGVLFSLGDPGPCPQLLSLGLGSWSTAAYLVTLGLASAALVVGGGSSGGRIRLGLGIGL